MLFDSDHRQWKLRCGRCGFASYNPNDIRHRYCGNCGLFLEDWVRMVSTLGYDPVTRPPRLGTRT